MSEGTIESKTDRGTGRVMRRDLLPRDLPAGTAAAAGPTRAVVGPDTVAAPDAAPAAEYHDPAWLVRRAWSSYRLTGLQAMIRTTIGKLQALPRGDLLSSELGKTWTPGERAGRLPDPVQEALRACSEELRDASGMAGSSVARAAHCSLVRRYISQQPPIWGTAFAAALDNYRHAACAALLATFQHEPAAV